jgi:hypothetical protein
MDCDSPYRNPFWRVEELTPKEKRELSKTTLPKSVKAIVEAVIEFEYGNEEQEW